MHLRTLAVIALTLTTNAAFAQEPPKSDAPRKTGEGEARQVPSFDDRADRPGQPGFPGRGPGVGLRNTPPGASPPPGGPPRDPNEPPFGEPGRHPTPGQPPGFRPPVGRGSGSGMPGAPPRPFPTPPEALEKYDPDLYKLLSQDQELERQTADMSMQYRRAPTEEREALKKQLAELVGRHFEVRQERRRLQLKRLEEELQSLRAAIEKRDAAREEVIHRRVSELLGVEDSLGF